jgi:ABC-type transport system involved in resistance to organic solvents, permease component
MERVQQGRAPFRAASFFRESVRAGVDSVPLVGLVCFFLGLTMALLTGYQLQRFGTERLIPGLVAIAFTRELGPLITGIMVAARIGAAFTANWAQCRSTRKSKRLKRWVSARCGFSPRLECSRCFC